MDKVETIKRFLGEELQAPIEIVTPEYPLITNKVIDSMGIMQVVTFIEDEYGVTVEDEDLVLDNFGSIAAIVALIEAKSATASN